MNIQNIKGLKYPDVFVTKFFFRNGLNLKPKSVVEFGCGNGNNLLLFYQYGWKVVGIDNNRDKIKDAKHNFELCRNAHKLTNDYQLLLQDITNFVRTYKGVSFDVILLPNVIYYLKYKDIIKFFSLLKTKGFAKTNPYIFISARSTLDYRYARGKEIDTNSFILDIKETGEYGCINTFLDEHQLYSLLQDNFKLKNIFIFKYIYQSEREGHLITNSDIILSGKLALKK